MERFHALAALLQVEAAEAKVRSHQLMLAAAEGVPQMPLAVAAATLLIGELLQLGAGLRARLISQGPRFLLPRAQDRRRLH